MKFSYLIKLIVITSLLHFSSCVEQANVKSEKQVINEPPARQYQAPIQTAQTLPPISKKNYQRPITKDFVYDPGLGNAVDNLGRKYALVIGVEYSGVDALDWTGNDALAVANVLTNVYGFDAEILTGRKQTTRSQVVKAFSRLKQRASQENDQVVVFFSGHGVHDQINKDVGYLVPSDGDKNDFLSTCVSMSKIQELSRTMMARHALFIIDSCYSGIIGGFHSMSYGSAANDTKEMIRSYMQMRARQILTAGRSNEQAQMWPSRRMSIYSYYLHRALEREGEFIRGDSNRDQVLTIRELQEYLEEKVIADTNQRQNPRLFNFTQNDGKFIFVPSNFKQLTAKYVNPKPVPVPIISDATTGSGTIQEILPEKSKLKGSGAIYVRAEQEGVNAIITDPGGNRYRSVCPLNLKELASGKYVISLSKPMYHDMEFVMYVGIGIAKRDVSLRPNFGWLTINTNPSGAEIYIDGKHEGSSPIIKKKKQSKRYSIKANRPRYHTYEGDVNISDEQHQELNLNLSPAFGKLFVKSLPQAAEVFIDGEKVGETPFEKELSSGSYYVVAKKALYKIEPERKAIIRDGQTTNEYFPLKPDFGILKIKGSPENAGVFVDGQKLGALPKFEEKLNIGNHNVKVEMDERHWVSKEYNVNIVRGDTVEIDGVELERKTGGLNVFVEPEDEGDVEVFVDGKRKGVAPCTLTGIFTGEHVVVCKNKKMSGKQKVEVVWNVVKDATVGIKKIDSVVDYYIKDNVREIKRDGRFVAYSDGTVLDTKTGLMWAARDNGSDINWRDAKEYCENYRGGGYTDWRMPGIDELAVLYDRSKSYKAECWGGFDIHLTELIHLTCWCAWARETKGGSSAAYFHFRTGTRGTAPQSNSSIHRVLPVRGGK